MKHVKICAGEILGTFSFLGVILGWVYCGIRNLRGVVLECVGEKGGLTFLKLRKV
jgi:hypothetical protein